MNCTICGNIIDEKEVCAICGKPFCEKSCLQDHGMSHFVVEGLSDNSTNCRSDSLQSSSNAKVFSNISVPSSEDCLSNKVRSAENLMSKGTFKTPLIFNSNYAFKNVEISKVAHKNQVVGSGAFGDVVLATHKTEKTKVAIKIMNKSRLKENKISYDMVKKEVEVHSSLDHPFIINLKNYYENYEACYIIMEYAKGGTLYSKLRKMKLGFSEETAFKYYIQTCSAIYFLHSHKLVHRDIKPENLLLDENNNIKLTDFGWCDYQTDRTFNETCGTFEYMSPQILAGKVYNYTTDIWSLGILLYELLHGETPFSEFFKKGNINTKEVYHQIIASQIKFKDELSENAKDLILRKFYYLL